MDAMDNLHRHQHRQGVDGPALQKAQIFFRVGQHFLAKTASLKMRQSTAKNKNRFFVDSR
jgi:hypothetical protein